MASLTPSRSAEGPLHLPCPIGHLPPEIFSIIMDFITEDAREALPPAGRMPAIASVSRLFRAAYFQYESKNNFGIGARPIPTGGKLRRGVVPERRHFRPQIGETLSFPDLKTMAAYFTSGPGCPEWGYSLAYVKFVRIVYRDNAKSCWGYTLEYAYEAFELLYHNAPRMSLQRLQVVADGFYNGISIETPGMWSLLKVRGLHAVILTGQVWSQNKRLANAVRNRLRWKASVSWRPLGFENPGTRDWPMVQQLDFGEQWQWLETRYREVQDRVLLRKRHLQRRKAYTARYGTTRVGRSRRRFVAMWKKRR